MKRTSLFCRISVLLPVSGLAVLVLAGCGQKGPLYLPQPAKPSPEAPKTAPAPAAKQASHHWPLNHPDYRFPDYL